MVDMNEIERLSDVMTQVMELLVVSKMTMRESTLLGVTVAISGLAEMSRQKRLSSGSRSLLTCSIMHWPCTSLVSWKCRLRSRRPGLFDLLNRDCTVEDRPG